MGKKKVNTKVDTYKTKHGKKVKKVRLRYNRIIIFLILLFGLLYLILTYVKIPISNFYISGNSLLSDQEIIDLSGLRDYPSVFTFTNIKVENKLKKNILIKKATVKKDFSKVYIKIEENYPLFYNLETKKTIMYDGRTTKDIMEPILVNHVVKDVYNLLIEKMKLLNKDIIKRISEIKYDPNSVDEERFLFTMSDGNYVYITLEKIESLNSYVDIIKTFEGKKGVLYLDSGEYFEVFK